MKGLPYSCPMKHSGYAGVFSPRYYCKALAVLLLVVSVFQSNAQTNIIDSTSTTGGSFQNLTNTFAANGWSNVNAATNKWFVGTVGTCVGSKGAYVGTASTNNNYTTSSTSISHFYRSVTFPAGETCINLSFTWKANGETGYDGIKVFLGAVGGPAPVASTAFSTTDAGATQLGASFYEVQASCGRVSISIPASFAGTTRILVFSWVNDNSAGGGTGAVVDNIGLISDLPAVPASCGGGFTPANLSTGITPCNPVLSWTAPAGSVCTAATGYYIYFGPALNPPLIDSTTSLSYTLGTLTASSSYYWKIVPYNANGAATGCTQRIFTTSATACGVSPGGVGLANVTGWFKADALTAGNLTSWTTTYPTGGSAITVTDPSSPYAQVTNSSLAANKDFNYNQYISFAGNNVTAGNNRFLYNTSSFNLMTNSDVATDQSSFFTVSKNLAGGANDAIVYWLPSSGNYGLQCRGIARMAIGSNLGNNTQASRDPVVVSTQTIFSYRGNRSSATSMTAYYNGNTSPVGTASECSGSTGLAFGAHIATSTPTFIEPFQGGEAESIFLNTTLTQRGVDRVHSYEAIKYGITLSSNYFSSSDATVFTTASPYNNNIIGIARDDASGLLQKQSHNADDSVRIYAGTLAATNAANAASFSSDQSFVVVGANSGHMAATPASNTMKPAGIFSRLEREWQVTKTSYGQTFSMDISLSLMGNPMSVFPSDLRLLVDNTGNFANATVYAAGGGLSFSYTYPVITVSGISNTQIPNNSTWNITIGSASSMTTLPAGIAKFTANCNNRNILLNWNAAPGTGTNAFIIERAADGTHFTAIGQMKAKDIASQATGYSYADYNLNEGTWYYRLKQTDTSGSYKYSDVISVKQDCGNGSNGFANLVVYPNPVKNSIVQMEYTTDRDEATLVSFRNTMGQTCLVRSVVLHAGKNTSTIAVDKLVPGIYLMRIASTTQQKSKVIKLLISGNK